MFISAFFALFGADDTLEHAGRLQQLPRVMRGHNPSPKLTQLESTSVSTT